VGVGCSSRVRGGPRGSVGVPAAFLCHRVRVMGAVAHSRWLSPCTSTHCFRGQRRKSESGCTVAAPVMSSVAAPNTGTVAATGCAKAARRGRAPRRTPLFLIGVSQAGHFLASTDVGLPMEHVRPGSHAPRALSSRNIKHTSTHLHPTGQTSVLGPTFCHVTPINRVLERL
jgi:hypothetical protein